MKHHGPALEALVEQDWNRVVESFAAMDNFISMSEDAEMQAVMTKLENFIESHQHAVYIDTPVPLDHG